MTAEVPTPTSTPTARPQQKRRPLHVGALVVLLVGALITAGAAVSAESLHNSNENRLLRQRTREAAAVLTTAFSSVQTPLQAGAIFAEATSGNVAVFRGIAQAAVPRPFASVSLWRIPRAGATLPPAPVTVVGDAPELTKQPSADVLAFLAHAHTINTFAVNDLLGATTRRLGYAYSLPAKTAHYVVYAESNLPQNRRSNVESNSAFSDVGYAIYLGTRPASNELLASSTGGSLMHGRRASQSLAFGDQHLILVLTPTTELGGSFLARLPWLLVVVGFVLVIAATLLVERLSRRRDRAEMLAHENARLYAEQRSVAQSLQHSLLPERLPEVDGLDIATRYVAGVKGIDIGGDWYDMVELADGRLLFVVGDVSGRGLHAATMMASLRYAIRAYALQGDLPATILTKLSELISVGRDGHFATVLCGTIDVAGHQVTVANAGHLEPLVVSNGQAQYISTSRGLPVGVQNGTSYASVTATVGPGATLLAYTDGLVERRHETLDVGLDRLKEAASGNNGSVEDLVTRVVSSTMPAGADDDSAILGVRWRN